MGDHCTAVRSGSTASLPQLCRKKALVGVEVCAEIEAANQKAPIAEFRKRLKSTSLRRARGGDPV